MLWGWFRIKLNADGDLHTDKKDESARNSAQLVVDAHNLRVKQKIEQFQAMEKETCNAASACAIVVTDAEEDKVIDETDKNANRLSIASNSSAESSRSENNAEEDGVNIEHGSSVFYVVWD